MWNFSKSTIVLLLVSILSLAGCGGSGDSDSTGSSGSSDNVGIAGPVSGSQDTTKDDRLGANGYYADLSLGDCQMDSDIESVVCAADTFMGKLAVDQQAELMYAWSDSEAKTAWSNFPTDFVQRNGLRFQDLDDESLKAAMTVARAVLSDAGYSDFIGQLAADDYLNSQGGGATYSSAHYYIAFFGYPSVAGDWMIQIGGHHLAYNITYLSGVGYPVPNHIGAEPKSSFEINSSSYAPLIEEGDAMVAMYNALDSSELSYAYLDGEVYGDVLVGPDEGSAMLPTNYPVGSNRKGVLVSSLNAQQQALVTAAIRQWVSDFPADVSDQLVADYTSAAAYADTYIAWAGTQSAGVDVDVSGTYMRIDGPRLWIEVACQGGIVIRDQTHYHTIYRDKTMDYANSL